MQRNVDHPEETQGEVHAENVNPEVVRLEEELKEKEALVNALTERLEQAAEKLDRQRRSGADRGGVIDGGIPKELVDQQKSLTEELKLAVQQWQDMQAEAALGRVECQLGELRDLISSRLDTVVNNTSKLTASATVPPAPARVQAAKPTAPTKREPLSVAEILAKMQAEDSGETDVEEVTDPEPGEVVETPAPEDLTSEEPTFPTPAIPIPELPAPIKLDEATPEELRDALIARDDTLALFTEYVQSIEGFQPPELELTWLEELTEAKREQLHQWQSHWQERLRRTEIELSLERARLSREANALEAREAQLRNDLKRFGKEGSQKDNSDHVGKENETTRSKNWLNLFGNRPDNA